MNAGKIQRRLSDTFRKVTHGTRKRFRSFHEDIPTQETKKPSIEITDDDNVSGESQNEGFQPIPEFGDSNYPYTEPGLLNVAFLLDAANKELPTCSKHYGALPKHLEKKGCGPKNFKVEEMPKDRHLLLDDENADDNIPASKTFQRFNLRKSFSHISLPRIRMKRKTRKLPPGSVSSDVESGLDDYNLSLTEDARQLSTEGFLATQVGPLGRCSRPVIEWKSSTGHTLYEAYKGQMALEMYVTRGSQLTVLVKRARHLSLNYNSYVKISLTPRESRKDRHRTLVINASKSPQFNEFFSIKMAPGDRGRFLSVALFEKRDKPSGGGGRLIGCMAFPVKWIFDQDIVEGWFYLLSEYVGKDTFLQAKTSHQTSFVELDLKPQQLQQQQQQQQQQQLRSSTSFTDISGSLLPQQINESDHQWEERTTEAHLKEGRRRLETLTVTVRKPRSVADLGLGLHGGAGPASVSSVVAGSAADRAGLRVADRVMRVQGEDVSALSAYTVGRIIRHYHTTVTLEIVRGFGVRHTVCGEEEDADDSSDSEAELRYSHF